MRGLFERFLSAFWQNEVDYLAGRVKELGAEANRIAADKTEAEVRLARAEARLIQYARLA